MRIPVTVPGETPPAADPAADPLAAPAPSSPPDGDAGANAPETADPAIPAPPEPEPAPGPAVDPTPDAGEPADGTAPADGAASAPAPDLAAEVARWHDLALRYAADAENLRKSIPRRVDEQVRRHREATVRPLLDLADAFDRALAQAAGGDDRWREGLEALYRLLRRALADGGLSPIEAAGLAFDPAVHEAVSLLTVPGVPAGQVVAVVRGGWTMDGRVVRPASVVVCQGDGTEASPESPPAGDGAPCPPAGSGEDVPPTPEAAGSEDGAAPPTPPETGPEARGPADAT